MLEHNSSLPGLEDGVALVTGAGSGIGRATAIRFAHAGVSVAVADIDLENAEETAHAVEASGVRALPIQADVANESAVDEMVARTIRELGRLDFAHNNAGLAGAQVKLVDYDLASLDRVLAVNLRGVMLCMRAELPHMMERRRGVIVNTASEAAFKGSAADAVYTATKHGVAGVTKTVALEVARTGLRVNAVCPGMIETAITDRVKQERPDQFARVERTMPVNRLGRPEEVADAVVWLCSDGASLVTGHMLAVDGGWAAA